MNSTILYSRTCLIDFEYYWNYGYYYHSLYYLIRFIIMNHYCNFINTIDLILLNILIYYLICSIKHYFNYFNWYLRYYIILARFFIPKHFLNNYGLILHPILPKTCYRISRLHCLYTSLCLFTIYNSVLYSNLKAAIPNYY